MKKVKRIFHITLIALAGVAFAPTIWSDQDDNDIRLVLQLTIDGLRADLLSRYSDSFGEGGFLYLKQHGTSLPMPITSTRIRNPLLVTRHWPPELSLRFTV